MVLLVAGDACHRWIGVREGGLARRLECIEGGLSPVVRDLQDMRPGTEAGVAEGTGDGVGEVVGVVEVDRIQVLAVHVQTRPVGVAVGHRVVSKAVPIEGEPGGRAVAAHVAAGGGRLVVDGDPAPTQDDACITLLIESVAEWLSIPDVDVVELDARAGSERVVTAQNGDDDRVWSTTEVAEREG